MSKTWKVSICPNDGEMVFMSHDGMWRNVKNWKLHTCIVDPKFKKITGQRKDEVIIR